MQGKARTEGIMQEVNYGTKKMEKKHVRQTDTQTDETGIHSRGKTGKQTDQQDRNEQG